MSKSLEYHEVFWEFVDVPHAATRQELSLNLF